MAYKFSKNTRLDRLICSQLQISQRQVKVMLAQKKIKVDDQFASDSSQRITIFSKISVEDEILQNNMPHYLMLNKPKGVVSATKDKQHSTVIDVIKKNYYAQAQARTQQQSSKDIDFDNLHIAGRLDFNSTGLLLLTNDGVWSRAISEPKEAIEKATEKVYQVRLEKPLNDKYIKAFSTGIYFAYENITTLPATLEIVDDYHAQVTLVEGRYHQIKRMFGFFDNKVLELHRVSIGNLLLDESLKLGQSRELSSEEVKNI